MRLEIYSLLEGHLQTWVEWRYASMVPGELFAMTTGMLLTLMLFANNLDFNHMVFLKLT